MARLFAGSGVEEISVGGRSYRIGADGSFDVPDKDAASALAHGLYREMQKPAQCEECVELRGDCAAASEEIEKLRGLLEQTRAEHEDITAKANVLLISKSARITALENDLKAAEEVLAEHLDAQIAAGEGSGAAE